MRGCRFLIVPVLALCALSGPAALGYPTEPSDSWVYPYLYELRLREGMTGIFVSTGPYGRLETAEWLDRWSAETSSARSKWLHRILRAEFEGEARVLASGSGLTGDLRVGAEAETGSRTVGEAMGRFACYTPPGVALWTSVRTSLNGVAAHKMETRLSGDRGRASLDYAGIALRRGGFLVSLSRDEVSWGALRRRGLLFSGTAPVFDMVTMGYRTRRIGFTSFHSMLRSAGDEESGEGVRRFVSAHRLEVRPTDRLCVAVSEAVIYGGRYRTFEPVYLNPFTVFYADQWNSGWNDNILIAGDFALLIPRRAEIRGEIMIDDFQYDFGNEPHEFGAGLSVTAVNPLDARTSLFGASYYHIRNQTYGHFLSWNRFIHEGKVMGYDDGPDGDRLAFWVTLARPESMLWRVDYSLRRKGEGRADDVQGEKGPRVDVPSGTVETSHRAGLAVAWRPCHMWFLEAGMVYHHERNAGHVEDIDSDGWDFSFRVRFDMKADILLGD